MIELDNLKKALEADGWCQECGQEHIRPAVEQLIKALKPTVAELNDEYLRDTHVEGMPQEPYDLVAILNDPLDYYPYNFFSTPAKGNALLLDLCQEAADEIERLKAETQEPTKEEILGKVFAAVYAQYPKKEWVGLSKKEVDELVAYPWGKTEDWVRAIEQALRIKNGY